MHQHLHQYMYQHIREMSVRERVYIDWIKQQQQLHTDGQQNPQTQQ